MSREHRGKVGGASRVGQVLRKAGDPGKRAMTDDLEAPAAADAVASATEGAGAEVPYRAEMERSFGADFSDVQAYTGRGDEMASIGAEAATFGSDARIAFADAAPTRETVAHELAHVEQARTGGGTPSPQARAAGGVSQPGDPAEREADAAASVVARGGTVAPGSLTARGDGVQRKSMGDMVAQVIADHLPGAAEMSSFLQAIAANDKNAALAAWATVPASTREYLDRPHILTKIDGYPAGLKADAVESVLEVLGPDAIAILASARVLIAKPSYGEIILKDSANAAAWVTAFTANPMTLFFFIRYATPTERTVTPAQAKQMADFADQMTGVYPELMFERIYPPLRDTSYDTSQVKTRAWQEPEAKRMFRGLADFVPPAHVQTIVSGFYLGTHEIDSDGAESPLGYGWFTSDRQVVMPAPTAGGYTGNGTTHGMSGGAWATSNSMKHFESTLLHEVGHGVGASTDGDSWARKWGDWKKHGSSAWSRQLFDDSAAKSIGDGLVAAGTLTERDVLPPSNAREWMAKKIAGRDTSGVVTFGGHSMFPSPKFWTDAEVETFVKTYYGGEKLTKYFARGLDDDAAYKVNADNEGADGRYYAYFTRWDDSHASYDAKVYTTRISSYSLSSPAEWFAEQYTEYYRMGKTGSTQPADVKTKFDELDAMKWDPDREKLKKPGAADDAGPIKKYTRQERIDEYMRLFRWWI